MSLTSIMQVVLAAQLICWTGQFIGHGVFEVIILLEHDALLVNFYHVEHCTNLSLFVETSASSSGQPSSSLPNGSFLCIA